MRRQLQGHKLLLFYQGCSYKECRDCAISRSCRVGWPSLRRLARLSLSGSTVLQFARFRHLSMVCCRNRNTACLQETSCGLHNKRNDCFFPRVRLDRWLAKSTTMQAAKSVKQLSIYMRESSDSNSSAEVLSLQALKHTPTNQPAMPKCVREIFSRRRRKVLAWILQNREDFLPSRT